MAEAAKALGNEALKMKRYDDAIKHYSDAIDLDSENAVYYSNRCAAYMKKGTKSDFQKALEDAESAIRNKRTWAKAYARKGNALFGLKKFDEAIAAYKEALEYEPDNTTYKTVITEVEAAKNNRPKTNPLLYAQIILHALTILCAILYLVPGVGGPIFFYHTLKTTLLAQVVTVLRVCGTPKWSKDYGRSLVMCQETHYIMPAMVYHLAGPFVMLLLPNVLRAANFLSQVAIHYDASPAIVEQAKKVIALGVPQLCAQLEVGQGIMQIMFLISPQRNIFVLMFHWQYLRVRYMISHDSKLAFQGFRIKLDSFFHHSYCPSIIGSIWDKFVGFLSTMGDIKAAQQSSLTSRCNIM